MFRLNNAISAFTFLVVLVVWIPRVSHAQPTDICRILGSGDGLAACPFPVWRENSFDSFDLNTGTTYTAYTATKFIGARSDPGAGRVPIHAFDKCFYVDNNSDRSYFVPFRTNAEWTAFISNHPAPLILRPCTIHVVYSSASATSKGDHAVFSLSAYSTSGAVDERSRSFTYTEKSCDSDQSCKTWRWAETISVNFQAAPPGWNVLGERVSRSAPEQIPDPQ
jgi:hypothetical protein